MTSPWLGSETVQAKGPAEATQARSFQPGALWRCGETRQARDLVVAIPVCNEEERIAGCIEALAASLSGHPRAGIVLLVNNSTDASAAIAQKVLADHELTGVILETVLPADMANAGWARRLALDFAVDWAEDDAVVMTTDADGRVDSAWVQANLVLLAEGAHLVCGRIAVDADEAATLPTTIEQSDALESVYTALSLELDACLDPRQHDPWPHHGLASGASLAVRSCDYRAVGGLPPVPCSEDRAFAALMEFHDLLVRHSNAPLVTVSCRLDGRARGGMADAIAARIANPDSPADQRLMPAQMTAHRAKARRLLRTVWRNDADLQAVLATLGITASDVAQVRQAKTFGALWEKVEAATGLFTAPRMRPSDLERELPELCRCVELVRMNA